MNVSRQITIHASDYFESSDIVVDTARKVSDVVCAELDRGETVQLSLCGLKGVPSSFFNVILGTLIDAIGKEAVQQRFEIKAESAPQRLVLDRSLAAFFGDDDIAVEAGKLE